MSGASQQSIARATRMSQPQVSRIEAGQVRRLSIVDAVLMADAVGLDLSLKVFPGRQPTRDAAHAKRLRSLLAHVAAPLRFRTEVPLPPRDGVPEQRAWDAVVYGTDGDTGVELELRLHDVQAQTRRIHLKWRDSGAERLLLVIADSAANRRALRSFPEYFADLPRLRTATVVAAFEAGTRPPSGYLLF